jgi:exopolysaccharide production protein ExoQ
MPTIVALILCTVFVLFLLRFDHKQSSEVSRVLWIPTIWMLSIASKPLGLWLSPGGVDSAEGSPLDRIFLLVLLLVGFIFLAIRNFNWTKFIKENSWLFLLIGYMLVSILWSDIPYISFKRWSREFLAILMAILVLTERKPRKAVESIIRRTIYICIPFSLLLIKYYPGYGVSYNWSGDQNWIGVTLQKNALGRLCLIAAFFIIWTFIRRWQGRDNSAVRYQTYTEMVLLILTFWLLKGPSIGAMSATAVTSLTMGLVVFVGLLLMKKWKIYVAATPLVATIAAVIIFGIVTVFVGGSTVASLTSNLGRDSTLTGRTDIWADLLPVAMLSPIVGNGVGGFWTNKTREDYGVNECHSGYLEIILDYGFIGLLLFSMFLLSSCWKAQRTLSYDYDWGSLWICYLLMTMMHNISETSLNTFTNHLTAIILFLTVSSTSSNHYKPVFLRKI